MISHRNVIANMMQHSLCDMAGRKTSGVATQTLSGLLPFSHIYGLVVVAHSGTWRGDEVIVLPQFDLPQFLGAIERFRINQLLIVRVAAVAAAAASCALAPSPLGPLGATNA